MIDPKNKLVFIHVPKCAGTSIENMIMGDRKSFKVKDIGSTHVKADGFLEFAEGKHKPLRYYQENFKEAFESYYFFTFVRNPWSRLHSLYNYMRFSDFRRGSNKYVHSNSFNQWVSIVCDKIKNGESVLQLTGYSPFQISFLKNKQNNLDSLDFIGKFENFKQDFSVIDQKFNFSKKNVLLNVSPKQQKYTDAYSSESKQKVSQVFEEDIDAFKYTF